jgi:hypothetical protein
MTANYKHLMKFFDRGSIYSVINHPQVSQVYTTVGLFETCCSHTQGSTTLWESNMAMENKQNSFGSMITHDLNSHSLEMPQCHSEPKDLSQVAPGSCEKKHVFLWLYAHAPIGMSQNH